MLRAGWQVDIALTGRGWSRDRLGGLKYGIVEWTIIVAARHALAHTSTERSLCFVVKKRCNVC